MKTQNRIWSIILTLSLVCSLFVMAPAAGFTAEEEGHNGDVMGTCTFMS